MCKVEAYKTKNSKTLIKIKVFNFKLICKFLYLTFLFYVGVILLLHITLLPTQDSRHEKKSDISQYRLIAQ